MAFEMICGQCRGNLLVEHFGVVVACPHCGAHLQVPAPADSTPASSPVSAPAPQPAPAPVAVFEPPAPLPVTTDPVSEPAPSTEEISVFAPSSEPPPSVEIAVTSPVAISEASVAESEIVHDEPPPSPSSSGGFSLSALMSNSDPPAPEPPAAEPSPIVVAVAEPTTISEVAVHSDPFEEPATTAASDVAPTGLSDVFGSATANEAPLPEAVVDAPQVTSETHTETPVLEADASKDAVATAPAAITSKPAGHDHVLIPKSVFAILLSYSSAMTIGFLYLLYFGAANQTDYGLESLPDVLPPKKKTAGVYRETSEVPDGHDLKVGDKQRFGNIEVSVLKVTRGPIQFKHFADSNKSRIPSSPVLKLWVRFKNVSEDQEIAPLDDFLLFNRAGKDRFTYRSNQFVCKADQKSNPDAKRIIAFDHISGSEWDLAGLLLDKPLQPGESRDYYVPTCENDLEVLTGDLLWRVHIRKGYSRQGNGVTTLFEVRFNSNIITDEAA